VNELTRVELNTLMKGKTVKQVATKGDYLNDPKEAAFIRVRFTDGTSVRFVPYCDLDNPLLTFAEE
jgi:hypothetical protein